MRVAVVIPNYNHGDNIARTIDSVLSQSYSQVAPVVVDDGSTDNSLEVIKSKGVEYSSLGENRGQAFAKNFAIRLLSERADIVAFLDSDDRYHNKRAVERIVDAFQREPKRIGLVYGDCEVSDETEQIAYRYYKEPFNNERMWKQDIVWGNFAVSMRAIEATGPFDESLRVAECFDYSKRVSENFVPIHIPKVLVDVRITAHSLIRSVDRRTWSACSEAVIEKARARWQRKT